MRDHRGGFVLAAALLTVGCAGPAGDVDIADGSGSPNATANLGEAPGDEGNSLAPLVDVDVFRQVTYDYEPVASPEELVASERHDAIVSGEVLTVLQGAEVDGDALHVVLQVRVDEEFRVRQPALTSDGHVYVVFYQGARYNDASATPSITLEDWNRAIPAGTPVVLFLVGSDEGLGAGDKGVPADARGSVADVQGVLLQSGADLVGGIEPLQGDWSTIGSLEELKLRIRASSALVE